MDINNYKTYSESESESLESLESDGNSLNSFSMNNYVGINKNLRMMSVDTNELPVNISNEDDMSSEEKELMLHEELDKYKDYYTNLYHVRYDLLNNIVKCGVQKPIDFLNNIEKSIDQDIKKQKIKGVETDNIETFESANWSSPFDQRKRTYIDDNVGDYPGPDPKCKKKKKNFKNTKLKLKKTNISSYLQILVVVLFIIFLFLFLKNRM
jgi:hypothetical protein